MNHAPNAKLTTPGVIGFLRSHPGLGFSAEEVAAVFDASPNAGGNMCRRLLASGDIQCSAGPRGLKLYHIGPLRQQAKRAPAKAPAGEPVTGFKTNIWKPEMRGYEAGLRSAAALAMATRA